MCANYLPLSDEKLVQRIDSPGAFGELESRYLWLVRAKARDLIMRAGGDRDELIQEGLLGLYDAAKTYENNHGASFKTYAGVCIYNRMLNELRRSSNKKNSPLNNSVSFEDVDSSVPSPELDLERREDFKAVLNQIHISLSEFEKKVLALYLSGYKRSELADKKGISVKAFDNAVQRVRRKLKAYPHA